MTKKGGKWKDGRKVEIRDVSRPLATTKNSWKCIKHRQIQYLNYTNHKTATNHPGVSGYRLHGKLYESMHEIVKTFLVDQI
jgi:hypothetical protein